MPNGPEAGSSKSDCQTDGLTLCYIGANVGRSGSGPMLRAIGVIVVIVLAATVLGMIGARLSPTAARAVTSLMFDPNNIVLIRESFSINGGRYTEVYLGRFHVLRTVERPESIIERNPANPPFAKFLGPNLGSIWIKGVAVARVREPFFDERSSARINAIMDGEGFSQPVREDVPSVLMQLGVTPPFVKLTTPNDKSVWINGAKVIRVTESSERPGTAAIDLGFGISSAVKEDVQSVIERLGLMELFAKLTRPDGKPVWISGASVMRVRAPGPGQNPKVRSLLELSLGLQGVAEDVPTARSLINAHGGNVQSAP
jgi:hypothetical protein